MGKKKKILPIKLIDGVDKDTVIFKPLLFLDFEYITSHYRESGHRVHLQEIVEYAFIFISLNGCRKVQNVILPERYMLCNDDLSLSKICEMELSRAVNFSQMISDFKQLYLQGCTKVISWGGSDLYNFNNLCKVNDVPFSIRRLDYIDLSQKFRRFYNLNQAITLEKALAFLNIDYSYDKHRAMPDAEVLHMIFNAMVEDGYVEEFFVLSI